ncbi:MAG: succinate dehydrogenase/fumarate reductase iron-sulfur subunit [Methanomassiliicoccales archaeon]|nr:succinate dehydrogenase/fumarate reductase iron-sulfur subunit [Methanomassiliicoccales archaeon]
MMLVVRRFDGRGIRYQRFEVKEHPGMTVLDALFDARDNQDDSLSFRYACRGAVCGSCAMMIDRVPRLACKTQISNLLSGKAKMELVPFKSGDAIGYDHSSEVLVEPLPNLPIQKDLAVDMTEFFLKYEAMRPFLEAKASPEREYRMDKAAVKELERYTNCILCAACYAACPVNGQDAPYVGPAALAKLYRFRIDPRESEAQNILRIADKPEGWWDCKFHANCARVCPKHVPPNVAIAKARKELGASKVKEAKT